MKAIVYTKYGSSDVLQRKEVEEPTSRDDEVLIKIHAAAVTPEDCASRKGAQVYGIKELISPKHCLGKSPLSKAGKHHNFQVTSWSSRRTIALSFRHALFSLFLFSFD